MDRKIIVYDGFKLMITKMEEHDGDPDGCYGCFFKSGEIECTMEPEKVTDEIFTLCLTEDGTHRVWTIMDEQPVGDDSKTEENPKPELQTA
jgi:hypothetical protein